MITATSNYNTALAAFSAAGGGKLIYRIDIAGYSRVFTNYDDATSGHYDWLGTIDNLSITLSDLDGGANQTALGFIVQDVGNAITSDFPSFVFEGKLVTIKQGFVGLAYSDFITVFTGYIDTVASQNSNTEYYFSCSDLTAKLTQVVFTIGDSGKPTDSNNIKTLNGHPLDLMLDILETECGLTSTNVDETKIEAYRDGPFDGVNFLFRLSAGVAALDFIKNQLLKPLGGYLWVNGAGKITVNFFYPLTGPVAVQTLGAGDWTSIPSAEQTDMVNTVQFHFDKDDSSSQATGNALSQLTELYQPSVDLYGQYGEHVIDADGMRSAFQGFLISKITARLIFLRYGFKNLKFDQSAADSQMSTILLEPGDLVSVTHSQIPDRQAGTMGITSKLFEILSKTFNFTEGLCTYTMIDASYLSSFGFFKIAPDGTLNHGTGAAKYFYVCQQDGSYEGMTPAHTEGKYLDGTDGNKLG